MALKALLLKRQIDEKKARMQELAAKTADLDRREAELEEALNEARTEEELRSVGELVDAFSAEKQEHRDAVHAMEAEVAASEEELRTLETQISSVASVPAPPVKKQSQRKDEVIMSNRMAKAFGKMTPEQRSAFIQREEVQDFLTRFREMFKDGQTRSVTGAELLIPTVVLELLRQNIEDYSKLMRRVRTISVAGKARQPIMGAIPEAVWTEACASLNELNFSFSDVEVDGYKVGGYVAVCNSLLEDSDPSLLSELIVGMGAAIGIALDKAILFGLGVKMPLGIATRLAQTSKPSDYPENAREWQNLSQSNVIVISSEKTTGLTLFQQIISAASAAKGRYSRGERFWAMNEMTYTKIQVEATTTNASNMVSAVPTTGSMAVVKLNGKRMQNGGRANWEDDDNVLSVSVTNGTSTKQYIVTVTKGSSGQV